MLETDNKPMYSNARNEVEEWTEVEGAMLTQRDTDREVMILEKDSRLRIEVPAPGKTRIRNGIL